MLRKFYTWTEKTFLYRTCIWVLMDLLLFKHGLSSYDAEKSRKQFLIKGQGELLVMVQVAKLRRDAVVVS